MSDLSHRPTFTNSISLGAWLQIAVLLVAAVTGYVIVQQRSAANEQAVDKLRVQLENALAASAREVSAIESRTRFLETGFARADERYIAVMNLLQSIDDRLARIERADQ